jgi:hypothetical protein
MYEAITMAAVDTAMEKLTTMWRGDQLADKSVDVVES